MLKKALAVVFVLGSTVALLMALQPVRHLTSSDQWIVVMLATGVGLGAILVAMWSWARYFSLGPEHPVFRRVALGSAVLAVLGLSVTLYHALMYQPSRSFFERTLASDATELRKNERLQSVLSYRILKERAPGKTADYNPSISRLERLAKRSKAPALSAQTLSMLEQYLAWSLPGRRKSQSSRATRRWLALAAQSPEAPGVRPHTEAVLRAWWPSVQGSASEQKAFLRAVRQSRHVATLRALVSEAAAPKIARLAEPLSAPTTLARVEEVDAREAEATKSAVLWGMSPELQGATRAASVARRAHLVGQPILGQPHALAQRIEPRLRESVTVMKGDHGELLAMPSLTQDDGPHHFLTRRADDRVVGAMSVRLARDLEEPQWFNGPERADDSPERVVLGQMPEAHVYASMMWIASDLETTLAAERRIRASLKKESLSKAEYERYLSLNRSAFRERYYDRSAPFSVAVFPMVMPRRASSVGSRSIRTGSTRRSSTRSSSGSYGSGK